MEETQMLYEIKLMDDDFYKLIIKFAINLVFATLLIRYIYYRKTQRKDHLFTYYMISIIAFMICFGLKKLEIGTGMGLGLFAIFGIIRYRTTTVRIKEMTYLFVVIGLSVVNALAGKQISYAELFFINGATVLFVYLLEYVFLQSHENTRTVIYEKIDLIRPEKREELKADLEERTGLQINKISIGKIDFLRDTAQVKIYYHSEDPDEFFPDE
ncbi:DUF4956 domain-containing protein [Paracrocinitomix mangrovi]|uniref:DUF4956 domain-containing protein n=1 Tax=Paracrocinitomix mangrovi TaxID=2862509 RepID=UPI001EDB4FA4|nr:DUF4956 domain-containing protein [Paracrocinitomix mangrovi]UKN03230.1 DUF4956 domain-containing protein [Paracrocinitomix mangrovi]